MKNSENILNKMLTATEELSANSFTEEYELFYVGEVADVPQDEGIAVIVKNQQIAIFNFQSMNKWFAVQNECPHKKQMALARGILGSHGINHEPKISCPYHKKNFSLITGKCLSDEDYEIKTYPVFVIDGKIYVGISS